MLVPEPVAPADLGIVQAYYEVCVCAPANDGGAAGGRQVVMVCNDLTSGLQSMKKDGKSAVCGCLLACEADSSGAGQKCLVEGRNVLFISHGHSMTDFLWKAGWECHLVFMGVARAVCSAVRQVLFLQLLGCGVDRGSAGGSFMSFMTSFMFKFCQPAGVGCCLAGCKVDFNVARCCTKHFFRQNFAFPL